MTRLVYDVHDHPCSVFVVNILCEALDELSLKFRDRDRVESRNWAWHQVRFGGQTRWVRPHPCRVGTIKMFAHPPEFCSEMFGTNVYSRRPSSLVGSSGDWEGYRQSLKSSKSMDEFYHGWNYMHEGVGQEVAASRVHAVGIKIWGRQIHLPHATPWHVQTLHRNTQHRWHVYTGPRLKTSCAPQNISSFHASWIILCCTQHWALPPRLSLLPLLCCCLLLRTQTSCPRIQLSTVKIHGRMALPRNIPPPKVTSPKGSSSTGFWSNHKIK